MLEYLVGRACRTARELGIKPRTVAVRLRYADGEGAERARSLAPPSDADPIVLELALALLAAPVHAPRRAPRARRHALELRPPRAASRARCSTSARPAGAPRSSARSTACARAYGHGVLVSGRALQLRGPARGGPARLRAAHAFAHEVARLHLGRDPVHAAARALARLAALRHRLARGADRARARARLPRARARPIATTSTSRSASTRRARAEGLDAAPRLRRSPRRARGAAAPARPPRLRAPVRASSRARHLDPRLRSRRDARGRRRAAAAGLHVIVESPGLAAALLAAGVPAAAWRTAAAAGGPRARARGRRALDRRARPRRASARGSPSASPRRARLGIPLVATGDA